MAFVPSMNTRNTQQNDESWKANGFVNFYIATGDGGRKKAGALSLRKSKPAEAFLLNLLEKDPSAAKDLVGKLIIEYQSAEPKSDVEFVL